MYTYITLPLYDKQKESEVVPEIYVHLPKGVEQPTKAIVICGGGGFNQVNLDHEGHQFAQWLNSIGVAGIVLNYRLPHGDKSITEKDLRQAVRIVREKAAEWNIDSSNIGAAGFSIGGHAVTLLAVREEKESKLDFTMLFYSVVSMTEALTHKPCREKLLGKNPAQEDLDYYSSEKHVSSTTPKCMIMACNDDAIVSPLNGVAYYTKLKEHNVSASLYIFPTGGHAWGMKEDFLYHNEMLSLVETWLK